MKSYNAAQRLLIAIGGTALLVAGYDDMYWSDNQFAKKGRQRAHMPKKGKYGVTLKDHFDTVAFKNKQEKRRAHHA